MSAEPARQAAGRSAWAWIPTLYFGQGIPYVVVMTMSVILYKRLGVSNADIALYTSWLYLPWVIKPLWSPIVELFGRKRQWIVAMQLLIGGALGAVAATIPGPAFFQVTLGVFWLLAFASATHDIAADGFYMLALNKHDQAWFVGVRSTFYRLAMIAGQGVLIMLAGAIETRTGLPALELTLRGAPDGPMAVAAEPAVPRLAGESGPLRLTAEPATIVLNSATQPAGEVNDLVAKAKAWNAANGFTGGAPAAAEGAKPAGPAGVKPAAEPSWWTRAVAEPLGGWLRRNFGAEQRPAGRSDAAGRAGVFQLRLSARPERDVVVNLGRESGDRGAKLLEGERLVFRAENWDRPALAVVQLDAKNRAATEATFVARSGNIPLAWSITFYTLGALFVLLFVYHRFVLPKPAADTAPGGRAAPAVGAAGGAATAAGVPPAAARANPAAEFFLTFAEFFRKPLVWRSLAFLLLYRFAEAQLVKIASLFLLDSREAGGLGMSTGAVGFVYGTVGVAALTLGGLLGGFVAARNGLKYWLPTMVAAINVPNLVYVYLAFATPESFLVVNACVAVEQFGYGFGFAAYMIYMLYVAQGRHQTAHYAICTGFMALGMMIPGMFTGWLQEIVGYRNFFVWVMLATIPGFVVTALIRPDPEFGKKTPPAG